MLEKTVRLLAKKDIRALHKLAGEMKKYTEHAKLISQHLIKSWRMTNLELHSRGFREKFVCGKVN